MVNGIPATNAINTIAKAAANNASPSPETGTSGVKGFGDMLSGMVGDANSLQVNADTAAQKLVSGEESNVHDVALSMAKADVSFQFVMEIRNRLIDSYQEIMRMQV